MSDDFARLRMTKWRGDLAQRFALCDAGMKLTLSQDTTTESFTVVGAIPDGNVALDSATSSAYVVSESTATVYVTVERWAASGHTVYDHKERPVRQYEPYFTHTPLVEVFGPGFAATPAFSLDEAQTSYVSPETIVPGTVDVTVGSTNGFSPNQRVRIGAADSGDVYDLVAVLDATKLRVRATSLAHTLGDGVVALPGRGVAARLTYDALGRNIQTDFPDGTLSKTEWTPWEQKVFDACDLVVGSDWDARNAAGTTHEAAAATASAAHANTPTVMLLDSLARPYAVGTQSGPANTSDLEAGLLYELSEYDAEGNVARIQDRRSYYNVLAEDVASGCVDPLAGDLDAPKAFNAFLHKYDLSGRELHSWGMDNGARWGLPDVSGAPALSWKGESATGGNWFQLRPEYDVLRRPTKVWETVNWTPTNTPPAKCRALTIYGEELSSPADANYLGRVYAQFDSGGATYALGYGLQGAPVGVKRTLALYTPGVGDDMATLLDADPDYTSASQVSTSLDDLQQDTQSQLESDSALSEIIYDVLGRVVEAVAPGFVQSLRAVHTYGYGSSGALTSIDVKDRTGQTHHIITHVEHNARGQRTRVERGNGVASNFSYDPDSFRVTRIYANGEKVLQDLLYTYDAAGNVLRIEDAAQQGVYFANQVVEPVQTFEVDALYRLTVATGREHAPVFGLDPSVLPKGLDGVPSQLPSDNALRTYTRRYEYDAAGNMRVLDVQDGWKRRMRVAGDSNRLTGVAHGRWPYGSWHWTPNPPPRTAPSWAPDAWEASPPATPYPEFGDSEPENWLALSSDQFGNMLGVPNVDVMRWDRAGNLRYSQSVAGSNRRVWYQYGTDNQRVRKVVEVRTNSSSDWRVDRETLYLGGEEFYRTYDGSEALDYERDTVHVMDGDRREAMLEGDSSGVTIRYMLSDHLRSASVELTHDGKVISYETFHPYGTTAYYSVSESSGVAAKRYRYSGKERDAETGLDYYGYRYLCSWLGRWVSADPAGATDGLNLSTFVSAQPIGQ